MIARLIDFARFVKRDLVALWLAARDPRTPILAKIIVACVTAYALSPIDLIPDFIPILGLLDDVIIVPAGIWLALRLVPSDVMDDCRARAGHTVKKASRAGLIAIILIWLGVALAIFKAIN